ncbi:MAG: squalene synthase HpnC [Bacteroidota bacterium]
MMESELERAYQYCLGIARSHYENFPVASRFLPAEHRPALAAVYAYARTADDFADEGELEPAERLRSLDQWQERLDRAISGSPDHPVFLALADTIEKYTIPRRLFEDLLTAFRWDVTRHSYETFPELLEYCRCSANPVGRIVLHIFRDGQPDKLLWSDAICTALQLTNFWQDVSIDAKKGRLYLPLEDLSRFRYTQDDLRHGVEDQEFRDLIRFEVERTRSLFLSGRPLIRAAVRSLRFELSLTWQGGMRILRLIERSDYHVLSGRPRLGWLDKLAVVTRGLTTSSL